MIPILEKKYIDRTANNARRIKPHRKRSLTEKEINFFLPLLLYKIEGIAIEIRDKRNTNLDH